MPNLFLGPGESGLPELKRIMLIISGACLVDKVKSAITHATACIVLYPGPDVVGQEDLLVVGLHCLKAQLLGETDFDDGLSGNTCE